MEMIAFIHAQQTAKTGVVTSKLATVLVVPQDIRVQRVTRVFVKNKTPVNALVLWVLFYICWISFQILKIRKIHIESLLIRFPIHFVNI